MKLGQSFNRVIAPRIRPRQGGFTLIELLVVIVVLGILASIALPAFLNQVARARQAEAKSHLGSINRGQQAFYLEHTKFANELNQLGIGISDGEYTYSIVNPSDPNATVQYTQTNATPKNDQIRGYAGVVYLYHEQDQVVYRALLCEGPINAPPSLSTTQDADNNLQFSDCNGT